MTRAVFQTGRVGDDRVALARNVRVRRLRLVRVAGHGEIEVERVLATPGVGGPRKVAATIKNARAARTRRAEGGIVAYARFPTYASLAKISAFHVHGRDECLVLPSGPATGAVLRHLRRVFRRPSTHARDGRPPRALGVDSAKVTGLASGPACGVALEIDTERRRVIGPRNRIRHHRCARACRTRGRVGTASARVSRRRD